MKDESSSQTKGGKKFNTPKVSAIDSIRDSIDMSSLKSPTPMQNSQSIKNKKVKKQKTKDKKDMSRSNKTKSNNQDSLV